METVIDPFNIQYDFGIEGTTEDNARYAEVWDGPILVAVLLRNGDEWIVDHVDADYCEPNHVAETYSTVGEFVKFLAQAVNA